MWIVLVRRPGLATLWRMFELDAFLKDKIQLVERGLRRVVPAGKGRLAPLHHIMRYAVFPGGKRIRPVLCLLAAEALDAPARVALPAAVAVELLHSYSLVHDDLPCMDNALMRRGKPSVHARFGEANALLAGDALLSLAFEVLGQSPGTTRYPTRSLIMEFARNVGSHGLVGGQYLDIACRSVQPDDDLIQKIRRLKTAYLFRTAVRLGAMCANADKVTLTALGHYGLHFGLAFQIMDDIHDQAETQRQQDKQLSCLSILQSECALRRARKHAATAIAIAKRFENHPGMALAGIARRIVGC
ncbi:MAG: polyprenyl synthetase family protein [Kiritimatiellia bacterium]